MLTVRDISSFAVRPENENALIEVKNGKHFAYRFRTNTNDGLLKESHIGLSGTRYGINWRYDKFRPLEQRQFPGTMTVSFEGLPNRLRLYLNFPAFLPIRIGKLIPKCPENTKE